MGLDGKICIPVGKIVRIATIEWAHNDRIRFQEQIIEKLIIEVVTFALTSDGNSDCLAQEIEKETRLIVSNIYTCIYTC